MAKDEDEILLFVREALIRRIPRDEIEQALGQAGWRANQVANTLDHFAVGVQFAIPVPRPKPYLSAREVFIYLVLFSALYTSAYNLGSLLFHFIDKAFPDPLQSAYLAKTSNDAIRWNISGIIVSFPLFIFIFRVVNRSLARDPAKRASRPRKWLTYLTLFVASLALMGDATVLIYNVLGGELTARFLLKVATVAIIAGGIFGFFLSDMRTEERV
jgi:hypothetical protein